MTVIDKFRLDGQVAIVTGAGRGLGRAMALALAEAGAKLMVAEIDEKSAVDVAEEIRGNGSSATFFVGDIGEPLAARAMVETSVSAFGAVDILVNNAGVTSNSPFEDLSDEAWDQIVHVNITGVANGCRAVGRQMIKQGRGGKIINISSMSGMVGNRGGNNSHYCATKGSVIALTRALAVEWAPYRIRVNSIAPGYFATPMTDRLKQRDAGLYQEFVSRVPLGRFGNPAELGPVVVFLASDASSYMSGHILVVDGAYTAW